LPYLIAEGYCTGILYGICFICFQRIRFDDGGEFTPRISGGHSFAEADQREVAWMVKHDSILGFESMFITIHLKGLSPLKGSIHLTPLRWSSLFINNQPRLEGQILTIHYWLVTFGRLNHTMYSPYVELWAYLITPLWPCQVTKQPVSFVLSKTVVHPI